MRTIKSRVLFLPQVITEERITRAEKRVQAMLKWELQLLKHPFQALPWRDRTSSRPMRMQLFVWLCRHEVPEQIDLKDPGIQGKHRPSAGTPCVPSNCEHTQARLSQTALLSIAVSYAEAL